VNGLEHQAFIGNMIGDKCTYNRQITCTILITTVLLNKLRPDLITRAYMKKFKIL
jgi:hypothetical protein